MAQTTKGTPKAKPDKRSAAPQKKPALAEQTTAGAGHEDDSRVQKPVAARQIVAFWKQNDLGLFGRRPDRLIAQWLADPAIDRVIVFELPTTVAAINHWLRLSVQPDAICASEFRLLLSHYLAKLHGELNTDKLIYCSYLQAEEALDGPRYLRWVMAKLKQLKVSQPEVWLWPICAVNDALLQAINPSQIIVDFVDDQRLFPGTDNVQESYTKQYEWLIRRANKVVSNSPGLITSFKKEFGVAVTLLENADISDNSAAPTDSIETEAAPKAPGSTADTRKRVGFVGNMRGRMHIPLLQELIRGYRDVEFIFVGQTHGSEFYKACHKEPNVRFKGTLRQSEADALARQFDLAIIPFVRDALVSSMSPIKSVTFSRLGVPALSTLDLTEAQFRKAFHRAVQTT